MSPMSYFKKNHVSFQEESCLIKCDRIMFRFKISYFNIISLQLKNHVSQLTNHILHLKNHFSYILKYAIFTVEESCLNPSENMSHSSQFMSHYTWIMLLITQEIISSYIKIMSHSTLDHVSRLLKTCLQHTNHVSLYLNHVSYLIILKARLIQH